MLRIGYRCWIPLAALKSSQNASTSRTPRSSTAAYTSALVNPRRYCGCCQHAALMETIAARFSSFSREASSSLKRRTESNP